jgi:hypothetical protein
MKLARMLLIVVAAILFLAPRESQSCGPFPYDAEFVYVLGPPDTLLYNQGKLGVVQPTYYRRNLIVAYRYLSGAPLTKEEIAELSPPPEQPAPAPQPPQFDYGTSPAAAAWLRARNAVPGVQPLKGLDSDRHAPGANSWQSYQACLDDAFATAASTLRARIARWGAASAQVAEWVRGQDLVFQNCKEGFHLPADLQPGSDPLLAADRHYQVAAAEFYAEKFADAERDFRAIGNDIASPWRDRAPYLIARTLIRKATLGGDAQAMPAAERQLLSIVNDPAHKTLQGPAASLLDFVHGQLDPEARMVELGATLVKPGASSHFEQDITDFTRLWDKLDHGPAGKCELADWITTYQARGNGGHALERWRQTGNPVWLLAALQATGAGDPAAAELIAAARSLKPDHPAYATAMYFGLQIEARRAPDAARKWADAGLASQQPADAHNSFLARRQSLARDWNEFLRYAPRTPVAALSVGADETIESWGLTTHSGQQFAADSVNLLNDSVPLARWVDAAQSPLLPRNLQLQVAQVGWARAIVLGRQSEARALASRLAELQPAAAAGLREYLAQTDPAAAHFAAIFLMLRDPGFDLMVRAGWPRETEIDKIDDFRDNWWEWGREVGGRFDEAKPDAAVHEPAKFLPPAEQAQAAKEAGDLKAAAEIAPDYLGEQALAWARQHPEDPRVPEALHLVVRATRFGNTGPKTSGFSKAAFQLLHSRYPKSNWTAQTPFWY